MRNKAINKSDYQKYIDAGLDEKLLGDWYQYDQSKSFKVNFIKRARQLIKRFEKDPYSFTESDFKEFHHIYAVLHNANREICDGKFKELFGPRMPTHPPS